MAHVVIIARRQDGLILAEMQDGALGGALAEVRNKASRLLTRAGNLQPRCSVDCGSGLIYHIMQGDGVCYLAMFDRSYPRNYAFAFLEDIQIIFQEELKSEFGTGSVDYRSQIDTIEKPYYFIRLDRHIARKRAEYRDPASSRSLSRLHAQLAQVSGVMQHNIEELLSRGESLEDVSQKAKLLNASSSELSSTAKRLDLQAFAKRFGMIIAAVLLVGALYMVLQFQWSTLLWIGFATIVSMCLVVCRPSTCKKNPSGGLEFVEEYYTDSIA